MDEQHMIRSCLAGDAVAWELLFDGHYEVVRRFVFQLGSDFSVEDVEEICQDTFLAVVKNLAGFQGNSRLQTWIFRIAANRARDYRSRQTAAKRGGTQLTLSLDIDDPAVGPVIDPPSPLPLPDARMVAEERMRALRDALDVLGDPCREILELRYFGDLSYEEIAAELEMNPKTVSSRLSKCLDRLGDLVRSGAAAPGAGGERPFEGVGRPVPTGAKPGRTPSNT